MKYSKSFFPIFVIALALCGCPSEVDNVVPTVPTNVTATARSDKAISITFDEVSNATSYKIYCDALNLYWEPVTNYQLLLPTDIEAETKYSFYVTSIVGSTESENSKTVTVTTLESKTLDLGTVKSGDYISVNSDATLITSITLDGLTSEEELYLMKYNTGNSYINWPDSGCIINIDADSADASSAFINLIDENQIRSISTNVQFQKGVLEEGNPISGYFTDGTTDFIRYDDPKITEFNNNPPDFGSTASSVTRLITGLNKSSLAMNLEKLGSFNASEGLTVDSSTYNFWVQDSNNVWVQKPATLRATGDHCYVWVADVNYDDGSFSSAVDTNKDNHVTTAQAKAVASAFSDKIYDPETEVFGAEYAGSDNIYLVDDSDKISIFMYDIADDYTSDQEGGMFGFFWAKDLYYDSVMNTSANNYYRSNETEMFYVDAHFSDIYANMMYSTLAHEFQHMLHFVNKDIRLSLNSYDSDDTNNSSSTWFNEMLSMVCEDMMQGILKIDDEDSPKSRFSTFNAWYPAGFTTWRDGTDGTDADNVLISYANAYAFGAYLARNYGGVDFITDLATNDSVDMASIDAALESQGYTDKTCKSVFEKWGQALVYTEDDGIHNTYNKSVAADDAGRIFSAVNLEDDAYGWYATQEDSTKTLGPNIYSTYYSASLSAWGFSVNKITNDGVNLTGAVTLDLITRSSDDEVWYILVK